MSLFLDGETCTGEATATVPEDGRLRNAATPSAIAAALAAIALTRRIESANRRPCGSESGRSSNSSGVARSIRVVAVDTDRASPFAASLLFDYVGQFIYEGDAPLAERRAQALTLDRELLAELLGSEELRELLDPEAVVELELELQGLKKERPG